VSKNVAMFVDVANMYYAARGQDVDVDYVALLKHATKGRDLIRAYAYTGLDPENENQRKFIDFLAKNGYKPVVKDIRKFGDGRMKANLDIELVVDLFRLADRMDIAVIVSGDGDFAPAIRALQDKGVRAEVISFKPNTSSDLIAVADEFMDIMKVASISRGKAASSTRTSMSAPEMPAKEVSPEFGFREASPSVAAAALAAIKTGGTSTSTGRRTRTSTTGRASTPTRRSAPAAEPADEAAPAHDASTETAVETGDEVRRRRRRRGGRGRGRSRRDAEATPESPAATGGEEIGWEEFDDLAQLDGAEPDHAYTFEEADASTLAELGLTTEETAAAEKPKRTRSRKAADDADGAGDEKPKRTRSRKAAADTAGDAAEPVEAAAPKRATRSRKAPASDGDSAAAADQPASRRSGSAGSSAEVPATDGTAEITTADDGSEEPQGIWGRFRSARKPRPTTSG
jgi:uncharacterized LabA/DUF88 family protein